MPTLIDELSADAGWFPKPHGLIILLSKKLISKSAYLLLDFIFAFGNHHERDDGTFYFPDRYVIESGLLSSRSIIEARKELVTKELIEIKKGNSHHATDYRILIPERYYRRTGDTVEN